MPASRPVPHSPENEQALLGACLLSGDARRVLAAELLPEHFHTWKHARIAEAILDLHRISYAADPITVSTWLQERGLLDQTGGTAYLLELQTECPSTTSAPTYAKIVADRAARRQMLGQIVDWTKTCYDLATPLDEISDALRLIAERALTVGGMADDRTTDLGTYMGRQMDYRWLVPGLMERGDRLMLTGWEGSGKALATDTPLLTGRGWRSMGDVKVDDTVFGPDGQPTRVVAATEILTGRPCYRVRFSDGTDIVADAQHLWRSDDYRYRMREARPARDRPTRPRGTDQQHKRTAWQQVVTTEQLAATLHARNGHVLNHAIPTTQPLAYPEADLHWIDPYTLGAWLGDRNSNGSGVTSADPFILDEIRSQGWEVTPTASAYHWRIGIHQEFHDALAQAEHHYRSGLPVRDAERRTGLPPNALYARLRAQGEPIARHPWSRSTPQAPRILRTFTERLRRLGVKDNKHIPAEYLTASIEQRLSLLQGLMDTDGTVSTGREMSGCEFSVTNRQLAADVLELLIGLGIKTRWREGPAVLRGREVGTRYRLGFQTDLPVFRLPRKAERLQPLRTARSRYRYITAVEPIDSVPVRCIKVARADGMFLAGRSLVATHNSVTLKQLAVQFAAGIYPFRLRGQMRQPFTPIRTLVIDLENSEMQVQRTLRRMWDLAVTPAQQQEMGVDLPDPFDAGRVRIAVRPQGIDLLTAAGRRWFLETVAGARPDMIVTGPIYKIHRGNPNDEEPASIVAAFLDEVRTQYDCALLLEAHSPHGTDAKQRQLRPYGASLWTRWPEFGFGLRRAQGEYQVYDLVSWRGSRDDQRSWPSRIKRGGPNDWPWVNAYEDDQPDEEMEPRF